MLLLFHQREETRSQDVLLQWCLSLGDMNYFSSSVCGYGMGLVEQEEESALLRYELNPFSLSLSINLIFH